MGIAGFPGMPGKSVRLSTVLHLHHNRTFTTWAHAPGSHLSDSRLLLNPCPRDNLKALILHAFHTASYRFPQHVFPCVLLPLWTSCDKVPCLLWSLQDLCMLFKAPWHHELLVSCWVGKPLCIALMEPLLLGSSVRFLGLEKNCLISLLICNQQPAPHIKLVIL